jgi:hypothetical protein
MDLTRVRTIKGQYKKLTEFSGLWSKLSFTGDFVKGTKHYIRLNIYNGDYQKNIEVIEKLKETAKFPDAITIGKGHVEYAPEIKTLWLVLDRR